MGITGSSPWYIYARTKEGGWTDALASTIHQPENIRYQLARFKHEVYAYALYYADKHKGVYLYYGRTRSAKAWFSSPNVMELWFVDEETRDLFLKAREDPTGSRSRLEEPFFLRYEMNPERFVYTRKQF